MLTDSLTIPPAASINAVAGRTLSAAGWREPVPIVYGEPVLGALILNVLPHGSDTSKFVVQCLWGYAGGGVSDIKLNGAALPAGSSSTHYDGTQIAADATLVAAFSAKGVAYSDVLSGFAYSVIVLPTSSFDGRLDIVAKVKGRKLYDPRKDSTAGGSGSHRLATPSTWEWSDNPALADADFLYSSEYGAGEIVDWSSVSTTANACDALVGGLEKRRIVNLALTQVASVRDIAETMRAYAGCWHIPGSGGMRLVPDADDASSATYAHESGNIADISSLVLRDAGGSPTAVEVVYTDLTKSPPEKASRVAQLAGAGTTIPWRLSVVNMPGITRATQAYREAVERLNKLTVQQFTTTIDVFDDGIKHERGDIVTVTHPIGLDTQKVRVTSAAMVAHGRWRLAVVQHNAAAYSDAIVDATSGVVTTPLVTPGPPLGVTGISVAYSAAGVLIKWDASTEIDYAFTELRVGAAWASATPLTGGPVGTGNVLASNSFLWESPSSGSHTVWLAHVDIYGTPGSPVSTSVTVTAPTMSSVTASISGTEMRLSYSAQAGTFDVAAYDIRYGASWAAGTSVGVFSTTSYSRVVDWSGDRTWWVAPIDSRGNVGTASSATPTVIAPGAVQGGRADIIDNNVLLYWDAPTSGTLPVKEYEVRKGATWAGGEVIGSNGNSNFTAIFEQLAGTYTYWIAAINSAGTYGTPSSVVAIVNQPPDYVLRVDFNENVDDSSNGRYFTGATLSGLYKEDNKVYGPSPNETIQTHFESRGWASPDAQIVAGYPLVFQPSASSGYYERELDYLSVLATCGISVAVTYAVLNGSVAEPTVQISYRETNVSNWTNAPEGPKAIGTNFRYVKVRVTFASSGGDDLVELSNVNIKLSAKLATDNGADAVTTASTGKVVNFTADFVDVTSINVTPLGTTARFAVYDFDGQANPTSFTVYLFDKDGVKITGDFSWTARGFI